MTGNELRNKVASIMKSWIGATKGSSQHSEILSIYNSHKPLARGYAVQKSDAYCATTVSAAWIKAGIADYTGTECGVPQLVEIAQDKGIWMENDAYTPKIGDAVVYDWEDGSNYATTDNKGDEDHVGIVTDVNSSSFTVVEGNMSGGKTGTRAMQVNGRYIRGFICPNYEAIAGGNNMIKGIDISEFQTVTDWNKVKAAGIRFVIIRTGYGVTYTDSEFLNNMKGAISVGLPIGIYHFSYALNAAGAKAEAERVISLLAPYKKYVTLPVYFDFEDDTVSYAKKQGVTLGAKAFNDHTVAFCEAIKAAGYRPGTYFNLSYYDNWVDKSRLSGYNRWFAQYNSYAQCDWYDVWQYSSSGSVNGIAGRVDMNQADESFLNGATPTYKEGWQKSNGKWWYRNADGSWPESAWKQISDKWYYFDAEGYLVTNDWVKGTSGYYYVGSDGAAVTNRTLKIDENGKLVPAGDYYYLLKEVPDYYRKTLDKLISAGKLAGKGGSGEDLILDMSEDAVRILVIINR